VDIHSLCEAQRESVTALVALLGLVNLGIPLPLLVFGGAGRRDQVGIHDRAVAHAHTPYTQVDDNGLKDLLA